MNERQSEYLKSVPSSCRGILERAYNATRTPIQVKAMCLNCMNYEDARKRVRECTAQTCPLWTCRPYQSSDSDESEETLET